MFRWWGPRPTLNMNHSCMPSCYDVLAVLMRHADTHTDVDTSVLTCRHICSRTLPHAYMLHACVNSSMYTSAHACIYAYMHMHTCTHKYVHAHMHAGVAACHRPEPAACAQWQRPGKGNTLRAGCADPLSSCTQVYRRAPADTCGPQIHKGYTR